MTFGYFFNTFKNEKTMLLLKTSKPCSHQKVDADDRVIGVVGRR